MFWFIGGVLFQRPAYAAIEAAWVTNGVVVAAPIPPYYTFFDASKIPEGATPFAVLGSGTTRLAVAYYTD